ncbi:two-component system response regulator [Thermotomaculum hydrothermale]|uniref:Two-component system response regulator n=1 Tax=Thermotomaculum hydrothermale TaxID=981385 RepID=A0A7R6PZ90_9BACT|nr:response regulator [Thermotomaculum hydrothermale]BBB32413.1 two-component system response regulator [Thermotomaculum hydrothermale]
MKKKLLNAIKIYIKYAYPEGNIPERIKKIVEEIERSENNLFTLPFFEKVDANVFALRLGNIFYPHMKLVVKNEDGELLFNVDTHDSPERIPPTLPGYEKFKKVIEFNKNVKKRIMNELYNKSGITVESNGDNTVVFLDDEEFILDIFKNLSQCLGVRAKTYKNGNNLLRDIEQSKLKPCICFVDIMMPEISGYDFVKKLREKKIKKFPVVFTTGVNPSKLKKDLCDDYLLKPVSLKDIESKLKKFKLL